MAVTVSDVKDILFGLDADKIPETSIQKSINTETNRLSYLRKSNVPDNLFDDAVAANAASLIASLYITATAVGTLSYSKSGRDEYLKNLRVNAERSANLVVGANGRIEVSE